MDRVFDQVTFLIRNKYVHRKGFVAGELDIQAILDHVIDEVLELKEAVAHESRENVRYEFGDVFASIVHAVLKAGFNRVEVEEAALEKMDMRFFKGTED